MLGVRRFVVILGVLVFQTGILAPWFRSRCSVRIANPIYYRTLYRTFQRYLLRSWLGKRTAIWVTGGFFLWNTTRCYISRYWALRTLRSHLLKYRTSRTPRWRTFRMPWWWTWRTSRWHLSRFRTSRTSKWHLSGYWTLRTHRFFQYTFRRDWRCWAVFISRFRTSRTLRWHLSR